MFWEQDVSDEAGDQMRHEIDMATMARVFDAALAFQDVVDGFRRFKYEVQRPFVNTLC
ncbi:MAG TPA: hypothetical protein VM532_03265 [Burkholderiales bacterium]|jgi:hypothetical protein|nr:hypothetical protein [Burkholderiales bacterium]